MSTRPYYGDCPKCQWVISSSDLKCRNPKCRLSPNYKWPLCNGEANCRAPKGKHDPTCKHRS